MFEFMSTAQTFQMMYVNFESINQDLFLIKQWLTIQGSLV